MGCHLWGRTELDTTERLSSSSSSYGPLGLLFVQLQHVGSRGLPSGSVVKNPPAGQETQETRVQSQGGQDSLEDEMATHSSILVWEIP